MSAPEAKAVALPSCSVFVGLALCPASYEDGLRAALVAVGEQHVAWVGERVRQVKKPSEALALLARLWVGDQSLQPAIDLLRQLGGDAIYSCLAARLICSPPHAPMEIYSAALKAIPSGTRSLAGLPADGQLKKKAA